MDSYVYLGVEFNYNGSFTKAINKQVGQAKRAMFGLLAKAMKLNLSVDIQCDLFHQLVLPILLYGSEIWGYSCLNQAEIFYRKFLKRILKLNSSTPNCMVYAEVGKFQLKYMK